MGTFPYVNRKTHVWQRVCLNWDVKKNKNLYDDRIKLNFSVLPLSMHIQKKALQNNYMVERSLGNMSGTINRRKPERCCFHVVRDHALPCEIVTSLQQAQSLQCQVGGGRRDQRFFPEGDYGWCDVAHGKKARPSVTWDATVSQKQFDKLRLLWDSMGGGASSTSADCMEFEICIYRYRWKLYFRIIWVSLFPDHSHDWFP